MDRLRISFTPHENTPQKGRVTLTNQSNQQGSFRVRCVRKARAILFLPENNRIRYKIKIVRPPHSFLSGEKSSVQAKLKALWDSEEITPEVYRRFYFSIEKWPENTVVHNSEPIEIPLIDRCPQVNSITYVRLELQAYFLAKMITPEDYEKYTQTTFVWRDGENSFCFGKPLPYFPGRMLADYIDEFGQETNEEELDSEALVKNPKVALVNRMLQLFQGALAAYQKLHKDHGILPLDISSGNIVVSKDKDKEPREWGYFPIDFADHIDRHGYISGSATIRTHPDYETEKLLYLKRQKANQAFFHGFRDMILDELDYLEITESQDIQTILRGYRVADFTPDTNSDKSTAAHFEDFSQLLAALIKKQSVEDQSSRIVSFPQVAVTEEPDILELVDPKFSISELRWKKIEEVHKRLEALLARLQKHSGVDELKEKISKFLTASQKGNRDSGILEVLEIYNQGLSLIRYLQSDEKIQEHRHVVSYRGKGDKSVLTMDPATKALIVFAGLIVFGLLALLVLDIVAKAKTGSQKLVDNLVKSFVSLRVGDEVRPDKSSATSASSSAGGPQDSVFKKTREGGGGGRKNSMIRA